MASVTLKDIPPKIHQALKRRAERSGRSLNREIIAILSSAVAPQKFDVESFLAEAAENRASLPGRLTEKLLDEASNTGRP